MAIRQIARQGRRASVSARRPRPSPVSPPRPRKHSTGKMAAARIPSSSPPPPPDPLTGAAAGNISNIYHSSETLLREIKSLVARHSDRLSMDTIRTSNKGYSADLFVVSFNHVKESVDNGSKVHILPSFGQHGREFITPEVALHLLYMVMEKPKIAGVDLSSFEKLLENLVIKITQF